MWNDFLKNTLLKPLFERLGTAGAVLLVAAGDRLCAWTDQFCGLVTRDGATMTATWVVAVALICMDIALAHLSRKRTIEKAKE